MFLLSYRWLYTLGSYSINPVFTRPVYDIFYGMYQHLTELWQSVTKKLVTMPMLSSLYSGNFVEATLLRESATTFSLVTQSILYFEHVKDFKCGLRSHYFKGTTSS